MKIKNNERKEQVDIKVEVKNESRRPKNRPKLISANPIQSNDEILALSPNDDLFNMSNI